MCVSSVMVRAVESWLRELLVRASAVVARVVWYWASAVVAVITRVVGTARVPLLPLLRELFVRASAVVASVVWYWASAVVLRVQSHRV